MAKSALSSFLIRKFQQTLLQTLRCHPCQVCSTFCHSISFAAFRLLFVLSIIAAILAANKKTPHSIISSSNPRVIPSRGYRKLSRRKQPYPKGNNRKPHKTTLLQRKQPKNKENERLGNHLNRTTNHLPPPRDSPTVFQLTAFNPCPLMPSA